MEVGESVPNTITKDYAQDVYNLSSYTDEFYFYFPSPIVTVNHEFEVYDFLDWSADCAGMGGILLGLSIVGGYKWLVKFHKRVIRNKILPVQLQ